MNKDLAMTIPSTTYKLTEEGQRFWDSTPGVIKYSEHRQTLFTVLEAVKDGYLDHILAVDSIYRPAVAELQRGRNLGLIVAERSPVPEEVREQIRFVNALLGSPTSSYLGYNCQGGEAQGQTIFHSDYKHTLAMARRHPKHIHHLSRLIFAMEQFAVTHGLPEW